MAFGISAAFERLPSLLWVKARIRCQLDQNFGVAYVAIFLKKARSTRIEYG